ncbi:MAG: hypothetical protein CM1200mP16_03910 [Nitrospina sp.]|nr:MAG: hypothetical protein CM1200mP16_03910 [Nitrospina sp.]
MGKCKNRKKTRANFGKCFFYPKKGKGFLTEVGHYEMGMTPEGIYDLGGNVAEWVNDWYEKKILSQDTLKKTLKVQKKGKYHVIKGGAWNSPSPRI